jgi:hypothetical protein
MAKKLDHAKHNQRACEFLRADGRYLDWVVTTAFYSAIHYVDHLLFPGTFDDPETGRPKNFDSFDKIYRAYRFSSGELDKHSYRSFLVDEHCSEFCVDFKTLRDMCGTARYKDYQVETEIADLCVACLENIREQCEPI